ncbi:ribosomal protein L7/L12 [Candidatus Vidania fulgoroideorum]
MKVKKIFDDICNLNFLDIYKLLKLFKKKFKINYKEKKEKIIKKDPKIHVKEYSGNKISLIRTIKEILSCDLLSSKKIVDNIPFTIEKKFNDQETKEIKKKLEKLGCVVELK